MFQSRLIAPERFIWPRFRHSQLHSAKGRLPAIIDIPLYLRWESSLEYHPREGPKGQVTVETCHDRYSSTDTITAPGEHALQRDHSSYI